MKTCSGCKVEKGFDVFSLSSVNKDGRQNYCKACASAKRRERYYSKIELERAANRQWMIENRPWDKSEVRDRINTWRRGHDRSVEKSNRRALEMSAEGSYTLEEWYAVCESSGNRCLSCLRPDVKLTQDHVVPLSAGGTNFITNIQPLCGPCNSSKGTKTMDYRIEAR